MENSFRMRSHVRFGYRAYAFTLIELLVIIAIIAILASVLFPVFAQAREKARSTTCLSNLKQITMAEIMYSQDYDETFGFFLGNCVGNEHIVQCVITDPIAQVVHTYLKGEQALFCPDRTTNSFDCGGPCFGYGYNWSFYNGWDDGTGMLHAAQILPGGNGSLLSGKSHAEFTQPASTFLIGDTWDTMPYTLDVYATWNGPGSSRHSGGLNFGFVDGHVKWSPMRHGMTKADTYVVGNASRTHSIPQADTLTPANPDSLNSYCSDPEGADCNAIKSWFLHNTVFDNLH